MNIKYWIKNVCFFDNDQTLIRGSLLKYYDDEFEKDFDFVVFPEYRDVIYKNIIKDNVLGITHINLVNGIGIYKHYGNFGIIRLYLLLDTLDTQLAQSGYIKFFILNKNGV